MSTPIIKKWLAAENGPGGEHLIKLMAVSPAVRRFVDGVAYLGPIQVGRTPVRCTRAVVLYVMNFSARA